MDMPIQESSQQRRAGGVPRVLNKYMLPKVAFTFITLASIAGSILTALRQGWSGWEIMALRWATYWTWAALLGAEMWKIFYMRPSVRIRPKPNALVFGEAMLQIHRKWQKVLLTIGIILVVPDLISYYNWNPVTQPWVIVETLFLLLATVGIFMTQRLALDPQRQDLPSWLTLIGLAGFIASMGGMDVVTAYGHPYWLLVPNRMLHLWAFSAWLGGALWNIFIAVPSGVIRQNMDTVILANFQLERFRVVVRTAFPTIVITGLVQAWVIFGWNWHALFNNIWGYLIVSKLSLIVLLVGVFITCPMWKACSPIRGVCNLEDLE